MVGLSFPLSGDIRIGAPFLNWQSREQAVNIRNPSISWTMDTCMLRDTVANQSQSHFRARNVEDTYVRQPVMMETPANALVAPERDAAVDGLLSLISKKRKRESPMTVVYPSKSRLPVSPVANTPTTDTESLMSDKQDVSVMEWTAKQENYQRELRRARQIRYRKKQYDHMKTMEVENRRLREDIEKLEERRLNLSRVLPIKESAWSMALQYFSIFRNGLTQATTSYHFDFLRDAITRDMVLNTGRGFAAMIRSWKCISLWFQDVELELEGVEKGNLGSLTASTTTKFTVTERTLRNVFPHLCSNNDKYYGLAYKLLGQRITMRGFIRFEWDSTERRVSSMVAQSDLLTPVLHLVGSLEKVALVFEKSIISPDFQWRSTSN